MAEHPKIEEAKQDLADGKKVIDIAANLQKSIDRQEATIANHEKSLRETRAVLDGVTAKLKSLGELPDIAALQAQLDSVRESHADKRV